MTPRATNDVVVVGAGPVGLTFAALLASGPAAERLRVRVIDAQGPTEWSEERMDIRVYALSRASQNALERLAKAVAIQDKDKMASAATAVDNAGRDSGADTRPAEMVITAFRNACHIHQYPDFN